MDVKEFRKSAQEMIDYIADYLDSVSERRVSPDVSPGFLISLLPPTAPATGESFEKIMKDFETYIMPGLLHWQHPRFHAYFPSCGSFPGILAEMLSDIRECVRFNSVGSELEEIVLDWFAQMIGLPEEFRRYGEGSRGGGITRDSTAKCVLISMVTARNYKIKKLQDRNPSLSKHALLSSLMGYTSKEAHSCIQIGGLISLVNIKTLETDEDYRLRGKTLARAIEEDKKNGFVPFFTNINLGTFSCCACDPIDEIGAICSDNDMWLHVDASYGGNALICPEFKYLLKGIKYVSSFSVSPSKWVLANLDCSVMWVKDRFKINDALIIDKTTFEYDFSENECCYRRFRVMKLWFVMRIYGIGRLQRNIRNHIHLAKIFEKYVQSDDRFELLHSQFGLVCFRLKGSNELNKKLVMGINSFAKLHITACILNGKRTIRFLVGVERAKEDDITYAWSVFTEFADKLLQSEEIKRSKDSSKTE